MITQSPEQYYQERITSLTSQLQTHKKRYNNTAWLRLLVAAIAALTIYLMWGSDWRYILLVFIIALAIFLRLVAVSSKQKQIINNLQALININTEEIKFLHGQYTTRPDGVHLQLPHHPYAHDLDIFGKASIFQYVHRTTTEQGNRLLANWLLEPADETSIKDRQEAAKELSAQPEWRQQLQAYGTANPLSFSIQDSLSRWITQPHQFKNNTAWKYARFILPAISISFLVLHIFDIIQPALFYSMVLVFLAASGYVTRLVTPQYLQLSKHISQFETLSQSLQWIESAEVKSSLLTRLKDAIKTNEKDRAIPASKEVKLLKQILDRMDYRLNPIVFIPLNILLFWDLQQVLQLEDWKEKHQHKINDWFKTVAEIEALSSFGNLAFNHPDWTFPVIHADWFKLSCINAGHPLLSSSKSVKNNFTLHGYPQLAFITGSNMAGKSTFLRTIGTNLVLAMAGAPVCASHFETSVLKVMTSMRIADNLEESASTFYAELQKLKSIIDAVKRSDVSKPPPRVFVLLDEILRGTNSLDRHTGSEALIKQLIKEEAVSIIASHDLSLAQLEDQYQNTIHNYHFDVTIQGSELSFDYKLKQGVCQTLNATLLMKKIGIEM